MTATAPRELELIGLDASKFFYSDKKSWRGPCPKCGGNRRFVMFTNHDWPLWNGFCDECGTTIKAWERVKIAYDPAKAAAAKAEQEAEERARAEYRRNKLSEFTTKEIWAELSERLTDEHIAWWERNGIPEDLLRFARIGYKAYKFYYDSEKKEQHSPAYTIPWFGENYTFETMQYRLINPVNPKDRYRFESDLGGGSNHFYRVCPSEPIGDSVIICEGAKKAIVTWQWLAAEQTVIAAASANTLAPALEATKDCGLRYVILDPGAEHWANQIKDANTRIVDLPFKIDDGYNDYGFTREDFENALKQSRKVK